MIADGSFCNKRLLRHNSNWISQCRTNHRGDVKRLGQCGILVSETKQPKGTVVKTLIMGWVGVRLFASFSVILYMSTATHLCCPSNKVASQLSTAFVEGNQWTTPSLCCWTDIIVVCHFFVPFCKSTLATRFQWPRPALFVSHLGVRDHH